MATIVEKFLKLKVVQGKYPGMDHLVIVGRDFISRTRTVQFHLSYRVGNQRPYFSVLIDGRVDHEAVKKLIPDLEFFTMLHFCDDRGVPPQVLKNAYTLAGGRFQKKGSIPELATLLRIPTGMAEALHEQISSGEKTASYMQKFIEACVPAWEDQANFALEYLRADRLVYLEIEKFNEAVTQPLIVEMEELEYAKAV